MKIVEYRQSYEREVVELWERALKPDAVTITKFRRQALLDDNFDKALFLIALEEETVVGFILGTKRKFPYLERGLEPAKGWINVMAVDKPYQHKGYGQKLLDEMEQRLTAKGVKEIILAAYSPSYFMSGIDAHSYHPAVCFFEKNGYQAGKKAYSMYCSLHGFSMSQKVKAQKLKAQEQGYRFIPYTAEYLIDILDFARDEFGGGWKRNLLLAMQADRAEDTVLIAVDKENQIVGFCMRQMDGNPLRFGPIGVSQKIRNLGLGGILLETMQEEAVKRGIYHLFFLSTDDPGKRFYLRHGFTMCREFTDYRKEF